MPKRIIVIYIDALSRWQAIHKIPKTMLWLEEQAEEKKSTHSLFQSLRYHSVVDHTFNNFLAFYYGIQFGDKDSNT